MRTVSRPAARLVAIAVAAALAAAALPPPPPARAQEVGDRVEVTLKNGRKLVGTLLAKSDEEVKIRFAERDLALSTTMVESVARVTPAGEAPAPAPAPAPGTGAAEGGAEAGAPAPAAITLADGRVVRGFVVKKDDRTVWVVTGTPRALPASSVRKIEGAGTGVPREDGFSASGSTLERARKLVEELASEDRGRARGAAGALEAMEEAGTEALAQGARHPKVEVRLICIAMLGKRRAEVGVAPVLEVLLTDSEQSARIAAASAFGGWTAPGVRKGLLKSAAEDKSASVRAAALAALALNSGAEEVEPLLELTDKEIVSDPAVKASLYRALRHAAAKEWADDAELWREWWEDDGGRAETAERIRQIEVDRSFGAK